MEDFASWLELGICSIIIMFVLYAWGRLRRYMARLELKKVEALLHARKAKQAVKKLEGLKPELEDSVHYWYILGLSFAQLGSVAHAEQAFLKVQEFEEKYLDTQQHLQMLSQS